MDIILDDFQKIGKGKRRLSTSTAPSAICKLCSSMVRIDKRLCPSSVRHLVSHVKFHLDYNPYICPVCNNAYKVHSNAKQHITQKHQSDAQPLVFGETPQYWSDVFEKTKKCFPDFEQRIDVFATKRRARINPKKQGTLEEQFLDLSGIQNIKEINQKAHKKDYFNYLYTTFISEKEETSQSNESPGPSKDQAEIVGDKFPQIKEGEVINCFNLSHQDLEEEVQRLRAEVEELKRDKIETMLILGETQLKKEQYKKEVLKYKAEQLKK
ncbi:unnamed protein product, partial [Mesorhabditis belari]|uniref:C2H2-type domain-containing protein n=1 Tax=Mesorhabditis belari TaxID=2138241 RepID=A0AAF3J925_9BILA